MIVGLSMLMTSLIVNPLALDGDTATETGGSGEAIALVSVISIVGGYLLLFALWRYVFSERAKVKRGEPPDRSDRR
jgi:hypothetical protein